MMNTFTLLPIARGLASGGLLVSYNDAVLLFCDTHTVQQFTALLPISKNERSCHLSNYRAGERI